MMKTWLLPLAAFAVGVMAGAAAFGDWSEEVPAPEPGTVSESGSPAPARDLADPSEPDPLALAVALPEPEGATADPAAGPQTVESDDTRLETALAAWRRLESEIGLLQARLASVEQALAERPGDDRAEADRPTPPRTADDQRAALVASGVDPVLADDIIWRDSRLELERLNLRDLAVREGWMGTDRYREELRAIRGEERSIREDIGDDAWDRYLYTTGEDNRVAVRSVIPGSAAEAAGLRPGDLIEAYAGERLFDFSEIREATTEGEVGELVPIQVRRGGSAVEAWLPRGPLGIQMETERVQPLP